MNSVQKIIVAALMLISLGVCAQCVEGDCMNGRGAYIYPSGAKYVGSFKEGRIDGTGILYFSNGDVYDGEWRGYYREGKGKLKFADGSTYIGEFEKSLFNGKGIMTYINGDSYEGDWKDNRSDGVGRYSFYFGDKYEGEFQDGNFHGDGVYYFKDGSRFKGTWIDNRKHGEGLSILVDGSESVTHWEHGELVEEQWDDFKETIKEDIASSAPQPSADMNDLTDCSHVHCKSGLGYFSYHDGSRYEGEFKNGLPHGNGRCFYANGDRYVGGWRHHTPHGDGVMYFSTGQVYGAHWENGKPIKELDLKQEIKLRKQIPARISKEVKIWALVVGVASYAHMPVLKYTDDDAYRMYAFLKSPEGGALPDNQLKVLIDDEANRQNIVDAMQDIFLQADENDVVMMYYSGHGLDGSFLPIDFNGYENKLHHADIKYILDQSQARHKLFIADACYSGSFSQAKTYRGFNTGKLYQGLQDVTSSTAFLLSSSDREVSLEGGGLRQGVFTHYLLRGMKGEADMDANNVVEVQELYDYVYKEVRKYTGNNQTPVISGKYDVRMPVSVLRSPEF